MMRSHTPVIPCTVSRCGQPYPGSRDPAERIQPWVRHEQFVLNDRNEVLYPADKTLPRASKADQSTGKLLQRQGTTKHASEKSEEENGRLANELVWPASLFGKLTYTSQPLQWTTYISFLLSWVWRQLSIRIIPRGKNGTFRVLLNVKARFAGYIMCIPSWKPLVKDHCGHDSQESSLGKHSFSFQFTATLFLYANYVTMSYYYVVVFRFILFDSKTHPPLFIYKTNYPPAKVVVTILRLWKVWQ